MNFTLIDPTDLSTDLQPKPLDDNPFKIPFFLEGVSDGFPSSAQDFVEKRLDVNDLCLTDEANTFIVTVSGKSMINAGIHDGDVLVDNCALKARHGDFVVATIYGEQTVKELHTKPVARLMTQ